MRIILIWTEAVWNFMSSCTAANQPFTTLYADHHSWLFGWLRGKLGNAAEAADLTHDAFVRIFAGRDIAAIAQPRAYLTSVAKGILVNWYRRQALEHAWLDALALLPEPAVPSPEEQTIVLETLHRVDAMLDALPAAVRHTFLLSQLDGLTYDAIAAQAGISLRTVKRHMKQGFTACLVLAASDG